MSIAWRKDRERFAYPVLLKAAKEGGFVVSFPDVPEALTQGEDKAEALVRAQDALETTREMYVSGGQDLPHPGKLKRGQYLLAPPPLASLKLALYESMRQDKLRKSELARRMGCHLMQIGRLLDVHHASRIDQIEAALGAMGRKLSIRVESTAA
jgi:antitoxin HicB